MKIALVGMMGSGKSKIGKKVANVLGFKHVDMDEEFEKENGPISDFFKKYGEREFRKRESELLKRVSRSVNVVISTGGGVVESSENRRILSTMVTFYLQSSVETLWDRVKGSNRPLAQNKEDFLSLFEKRKEFYEAFKKIDTDNLNEWEITAKIVSKTLKPLPLETIDSFQNLIICDDFTFPSSDLTVISENVKRIWKIEGMKIEDGEGLKTVESVSHLWKTFLKFNLTRNSTVNIIGGGTVTDTVGFACQTFMRGMNFNFIPTTLLGMVDAAIGGKFAINFNEIKNLVGTFGRPNVFINPLFSISLKDETFKEGVVEALKTGAVYDKELFEHIEKNLDKILKREYLSVRKLIALAAKDKLEIVKKDPYDKGFRHILNFGHTIAHAIESASKNEISHGHAVAIGMNLESRKFSPSVARRIENIIKRLEFADVPSSYLTRLTSWMDKDKKRDGKYIVIPVIEEIGRSHLEKIEFRML